MQYAASVKRFGVANRRSPSAREPKKSASLPPIEHSAAAPFHSAAVSSQTHDAYAAVRSEAQSRRARALSTFCAVDSALPFHERFNAMVALYDTTPQAEAVLPLRAAYWNPHLSLNTTLRRMVIHYFARSAADVAIGALAEIFVERDGHLPYIGLPILTGPLIVYAPDRHTRRFLPRIATPPAPQCEYERSFDFFDDTPLPEPPPWSASAAVYTYFAQMMSDDRFIFRRKLLRIAGRQHHPHSMKVAAQETLRALFDEEPEQARPRRRVKKTRSSMHRS